MLIKCNQNTTFELTYKVGERKAGSRRSREARYQKKIKNRCSKTLRCVKMPQAIICLSIFKQTFLSVANPI